MKLKCIVVDDSTIQRVLVNKMVNEHPDLVLVAEFSNAKDAKDFLVNDNVDLLFLDIEMPVTNGFNLLDGLNTKPQIIFITAKAEYALKAFDYDATDYLQKPITKERFAIATKRAIDLYWLKKEITNDESYVFIKRNLNKLKIYTTRIMWIEAFGDYIKIVTKDDTYLTLSTLKSIGDDLPTNKFIRVHKSFIINIDAIDKYNSKIIEIGCTKIPLSRNKKEELIKAMANN